MSVLLQLSVVLPTAATPAPNPTLNSYTDESQIAAGPIGFAVFAFLAVALTLLMFSLNKQLKRTRVNAERLGIPAGDGRPGSGGSTRRLTLPVIDMTESVPPGSTRRPAASSDSATVEPGGSAGTTASAPN